MSTEIELGDLAAVSNSKNEDPWAILEDDDDFTPWSERRTKEKFVSVAINVIKLVFVFGCLYLFICSLGLMGSAFQVLAGKSAGDLFTRNEVLSNPVTGVIIGILVTVLVQSSSTSTSIFITMTSVGLISIKSGIPLIMGANVGTSVTNTIVSLSQSIDRDEFRRAFAGATVHDIFNLLSVFILLPIELITTYLESLTGAILSGFQIDKGQKPPDLLKVITKPLTKKIISVNKSVITLAAKGVHLGPETSMVSIWCDHTKIQLPETKTIFIPFNATDGSGDDLGSGDDAFIFGVNKTGYNQNVTKYTEMKVGVTKCETGDFLFANTEMSDAGVGSILLVISLIVMCVCLISMVKLLSSILKGSIARIIKKVINTNFPYPFGWLTGYLAMLVGAGLTFVVQSSSVFTSTMTPLVGIGVISLKRMYPLTLGSNIGTTTTGLLAALASSGNELKVALQLALCHFFFNITGIIIWYPVPHLRRIPLAAAKSLGNTTAKHRWFAVIYLLFVFFLFPAALLGLSIAHEWALWAVLIFLALILIPLIIIRTLQSKRPASLPNKLQNFEFLPNWMHSLKPFDKIFTGCCKKRRKKEKPHQGPNNSKETSGELNEGYQSGEEGETAM